MKHAEKTSYTRHALANSLKKFIEEKPLSKITISEIVADCGFNRKTFYYHFDDIYALLKWMLEEEAVEVVKKFDLLVDCREAVLFVTNYIRENRHLLCCVYDSVGRDEMKRFLYADFTGVIRKVIQSTEEQLGVYIDDEFKEFVASFYTGAISSLLIDELTDENNHDPEKAAEFLSVVLNNSLPEVIKSSAVNDMHSCNEAQV